MRPLYLKMQAFGPYAKKTEIDYTKLNSSGLYLITGDTGAGKTTIFDGITYALYDKTSGNVRSAENLRSKYADSETETVVELIFKIDNKEYRIVRTPAYEYINRNGKLSKKSPVSELTLPDGHIYTKKKEVDSKIVEILGLDYEQFRRIVMIAQNDFQELLLDKGDKRALIFRKIFSTGFYQRFQDELKLESDRLIALMGNSQRAISQYLNSCFYTEESPLSYKLNRLKNEQSEYAVIEEVFNEMLEADRKQLINLDQLSQENEKKILEHQNRMTLAFKYANDSKVYHSNLELLETLKGQLNQLKQEQKQSDKDNELIEEFNKKALLLETDLPKYKKLQEVENQLKQLESAYTTNQKMIVQLSNQLAEKKTKYEENSLCLKDILNTDTLLAMNQQEIQANELHTKQLDRCFELSIQYRQKKSALDSSLKNYQLADSNYAEQERIYNSANRLYLANQAGILATQLKKGEPCPVCGSLEHPNPALVHTETVSESQLKQLKTNAEMALKKLQECGNKHASCKTAFEETEKSLLNEVQEAYNLVSLENLDSTLLENRVTLTDKKKQLLETKNVLTQKVQLKKSLEEQIPVLQKEIESLTSRYNQLSLDYSVQENQLSSLKKEFAELQKDCVFSSITELNKQIEHYRKQIEQLKKQIISRNEAVTDAEKKVNELSGQCFALKEQLKNGQKEDLNQLEEIRVNLNNEKAVLTKELQNLKHRYANNEDNFRNIQKVHKDVAEYEKQMMVVDSVTKTARGKLVGKDKIDFETFIQMTYFDRILVYANQRLKVMSDGQYTFKRGKVGLQLNVVDHYNGTEREVSTLSGGESFKASLSLALGLSDEVQSKTSSVHIDTMFVDEGFGTLDDDSLSKALDALSNLSIDNRCIGIISHVKELQQRIDQKIIVRKDKAGGSSIKLEV